MNKCKQCTHLDSCVEWFTKEFVPIDKDKFCNLIHGEVIAGIDHRVPCPIFETKERA